MLKFGVVPLRFCGRAIMLVVKNVSKSLHDFSNYRPVSIISVVAKFYEMIISARLRHLFTTHDNQFGFNINGGCTRPFLQLITLFNIFVINLVMYFCVLLTYIKHLTLCIISGYCSV